MNKLIAILLGLGLSGCSFMNPIETPTTYCISNYNYAPTAKINLEIRVEGRDEYRRSDMIVKAEPNLQDRYYLSVWVASPCTMFNDSIVSHYLSSATQKGESSLDIYIDAFDQVKINDQWFAKLRLKYEITQMNKSASVHIFERLVELSDSNIKQYVAAQNKSFNEFLKEIDNKI